MVKEKQHLVGWLYRLVIPLRKIGLNKISGLTAFKRWLEKRMIFGQDSIVVDVSGRKMTVWSNEKWFINVLIAGEYEPYTTELLRHSLKEGDIFLDIGAHIGYYSLLGCEVVGNSGTVIAFEPEPSNFHLLQANVNRKAYKNVELVNKAVGENAGIATLHLINNQSSVHSFYFEGQSTNGTQVEVVRIDDIVNGKKVNVVKIDVEGSEPYVLNGMRDTLGRSGEVKLFTEVNPKRLKTAGWSVEAFLNLLQELGFEEILFINEEDKSTQPVLKADDLPIHQDSSGNILCIKKNS
jgi:FkbM family methyltransferase